MSSGASSPPTPGRAFFRRSTDCKDPRCLHAVPIRAEVAVGKVVSIDCSAARAMDGVMGVFTFQDAPARKFAVPGQPWSTDPAFRHWPERRIFTDEVKYFGDMIGCVVACDHETAVKAARAVCAKYEKLPPVQYRLAETAGAPASHAEFTDNESATTEDVVGVAPETPPCRIFQGAFSMRLQQPERREAPCVTAWIDEQGVLTLVSASPAPHAVRRTVTEALNIPADRVRVIKPAAGVVWVKLDLALEAVVAFLTQRLGGRPVCLNLGRDPNREAARGAGRASGCESGHGAARDLNRTETSTSRRSRTHPSARLELSTGVDATGRMITRELMNIAESGCHAGYGHLVCMLGGSVFRQFYGGELVAVRGRSLLVNQATARALSGSGVPQVLFALESHVDDIALELGIDPVEFRLRNVRNDESVDPLSGLRVRTSGFIRCLEKGKALCNWNLARQRYAEEEGSVRRGVGMAGFMYPTDTGPSGFETAQTQMLLLEDGSVRLEVSVDFGPEADAVLIQTAADVLGIPAERVRMGMRAEHHAPLGEMPEASALDELAGTADTRIGRQNCVISRAVKRVAQELRDKILAFSARLLHRSARELRLEGDLVRAGDEVCAQLLDIAKASHYQSGISEPLVAQGCVSCTDSAFVYGATFAEVLVDIADCRVEVTNLYSVLDCGTVVRPPLAMAQVYGGAMRGGVPLSESLRIDLSAGRAYSTDRQEYRISGDSAESLFAEPDTDGSADLCGSKSLNEPATLSQAPAVRNAVLHATGVGVNSLPLSPQSLFTAFKRAGLLG